MFGFYSSSQRIVKSEKVKDFSLLVRVQKSDRNLHHQS